MEGSSDMYSRLKLRGLSSSRKTSSRIACCSPPSSSRIHAADDQAVVRKVRDRKKTDDVTREFEIGDLIWGKITGNPWWPGVVFDPAFAAEEAMAMKKDGQMAVFLYGDSTHGWIKPSRMLPFEPHFAEKAGKTDNKWVLKGVELALEEVKRRSILGFVCNCHHGSSLRKPMFVEQNLFRVGFGGFIDGGVYSGKQMEKAREAVQPAEMLGFLQQLAASAGNGVGRESADRISMARNTSQLRFYRNYVRRQRDGHGQDEQGEYAVAEVEEEDSMDFVWGSALKLKTRKLNVQADLNGQDISPAQEQAVEPPTRFVWGNCPLPKGRRQPRKPKALIPALTGGSTNDLAGPETVAEEPPREESGSQPQPQASTSGSDPGRRQMVLEFLQRCADIEERIKNL